MAGLARQVVARSLASAAALLRAGRLEDAERECLAVLSLDPHDAAAHHLLGLVAAAAGRTAEAVAALRHSIDLAAVAEAPPPGTTAPAPRDVALADFHNNLGVVLAGARRGAEAAEAFSRAALLRPDFAAAHVNLAAALESSNRLDEALAAGRRAAALAPAEAGAHARVGSTLLRLGRADEAAEALTRALDLRPDFPEAVNWLATALGDSGRLEEALACYRRALAARPDPTTHGNFLYTLHYSARLTPRTLHAEHLRWARRHARPLTRRARPHDNDPDPRRRLRVGYVSGEFREHPGGRFLLPVLAHHDHARFEVFCYSDAARDEPMTRRFRRAADVWRDVADLGHGALAEVVRRDRIDVLVEQTGHMADSRLLAFAERPAPVQVTYPGYPGSTGVAAIDYCLSDDLRDPPEGGGPSDPSARPGDRLYAEELVRLPVASQCYEPWDDATYGPGPAIGPPPCRAEGRLTFGSLNRVVKVTPESADLWARVLAAVPDSRLLVLAGPDPSQNARTARRLFAAPFARHGVPGGRLRLEARRPRRAYLELFDRVDVALDPYPYHGHTTTLDALWMGVPTVTLAGPTRAAREGPAALSLVGLGDLAAPTPGEYVRAAAALAADAPRLAALRRSLRERMRQSPLMDGRGLAERIEAAYRWMWGRWCDARRGGRGGDGPAGG